jgi:hypothetical protein
MVNRRALQSVWRGATRPDAAVPARMGPHRNSELTRPDGALAESDMEEYTKLKQLVESIADDIFKAEGGNNAAGTRVRKAMQDVRNVAQDIRKKILDMRKTKDDGEDA